MEERQSRLSSTVWRRFQQYFCVRLIPQNSMFSNFCHVLRRVVLKRGVPKNFCYGTRLISLLVQALKALKKENVGESE